MSEHTHVLQWVPPYLCSDGVGAWELQSRHAWDTFTPQDVNEWCNEPRDNPSKKTLKTFVAKQLGCSAHDIFLEPSTCEISPDDMLTVTKSWYTEPIYLVYRIQTFKYSAPYWSIPYLQEKSLLQIGLKSLKCER